MPVQGRGRGGLCSHVSRINIWMGDERESEDEVHEYDTRRFSSDCV